MNNCYLVLIFLLFSSHLYSQTYRKIKADTNATLKKDGKEQAIKLFEGEIFEVLDTNTNELSFEKSKLIIDSTKTGAITIDSSKYNQLKECWIVDSDKSNYIFKAACIDSILSTKEKIKIFNINGGKSVDHLKKDRTLPIPADKLTDTFRIQIPNFPSFIYFKKSLELPTSPKNTNNPDTSQGQIPIHSPSYNTSSRYNLYYYILIVILITPILIVLFRYWYQKKKLIEKLIQKKKLIENIKLLLDKEYLTEDVNLQNILKERLSKNELAQLPEWFSSSTTLLHLIKQYLEEASSNKEGKSVKNIRFYWLFKKISIFPLFKKTTTVLKKDTSNVTIWSAEKIIETLCSLNEIKNMPVNTFKKNTNTLKATAKKTELIIKGSRNFSNSAISYMENIDNAIKSVNKLLDDTDFNIDIYKILNKMYEKYQHNIEGLPKEKWQKIITNLQQKEQIIDTDLLKQLNNTSDNTQYIAIIQKKLYDDYFKQLISSTLILLEEVRNLPTFLPNGTYNEDNLDVFERLINDLVKSAEQMLGYNIIYVRLFDEINNYPGKINARNNVSYTDFYRLALENKKLTQNHILEIQSYAIIPTFVINELSTKTLVITPNNNE